MKHISSPTPHLARTLTQMESEKRLSTPDGDHEDTWTRRMSMLYWTTVALATHSLTAVKTTIITKTAKTGTTFTAMTVQLSDLRMCWTSMAVTAALLIRRDTKNQYGMLRRTFLRKFMAKFTSQLVESLTTSSNKFSMMPWRMLLNLKTTLTTD